MANSKRAVALVGGLALLGLLFGSRRANAAEPLDIDPPLPPDPDDDPSGEVEAPFSSVIGREESSQPATNVVPGGVVGEDFTPGPPDVDGLLASNPEGQTLYQVVRGDAFGGQDGIVARWLRSSGELAGMSQRQIGDMLRNTQLRFDAYQLLLCSWWNDALYGTYGYGSQSLPGLHGRAIRLLPQNADNLALLRRGESPRRTVSVGVPSDRGSGNSRRIGPGNSFELLWIPPLDLESLSRGLIQLAPGNWADGTSLANPPPSVTNLEVITDDTEYGCDGVR